MLASVCYASIGENHKEDSTFDAHKSPIVHMLFAKAVVVLLIFLLGGILQQELAATVIAIAGSL